MSRPKPRLGTAYGESGFGRWGAGTGEDPARRHDPEVLLSADILFVVGYHPLRCGFVFIPCGVVLWELREVGEGGLLRVKRRGGGDIGVFFFPIC